MSIAELQQQEWIDHEHDLAERVAHIRGKFLRCAECGGIDGMQGCLPDLAEAREIMRQHPRIRYYVHVSEPEKVYIPCIYCNPLGIIPDGYAALEASHE